MLLCFMDFDPLRYIISAARKQSMMPTQFIGLFSLKQKNESGKSKP